MDCSRQAEVWEWQFVLPHHKPTGEVWEDGRTVGHSMVAAGTACCPAPSCWICASSSATLGLPELHAERPERAGAHQGLRLWWVAAPGVGPVPWLPGRVHGWRVGVLPSQRLCVITHKSLCIAPSVPTFCVAPSLPCPLGRRPVAVLQARPKLPLPRGLRLLRREPRSSSRLGTLLGTSVLPLALLASPAAGQAALLGRPPPPCTAPPVLPSRRQAPEVLRRDYGPPADVWSLGVSLYTLLSGLLPFFGDTEEEVFDMVLHAGALRCAVLHVLCCVALCCACWTLWGKMRGRRSTRGCSRARVRAPPSPAVRGGGRRAVMAAASTQAF